MPRARLTLTIPEAVWIGDLSRSHPDAEFRVLAALGDDEAGSGLVEITGPDLAAVLADFRTYDTVSHLEVLERGVEGVLVQFETTEHVLLLPARGSGVPLEMPFTIRDGQATIEVTAPRDRLSDLGDQLDVFDIGYAVEYVRQHVEEEPLLTERQHRLLVTAVEAGYYDTPRECTLTDLADQVDVAKSTASEVLHRAESKVVRDYVEESGDVWD